MEAEPEAGKHVVQIEPGSGFRAQSFKGLGFKQGFRVESLGCRDLGFRVYGRDLGFWVESLGFRDIGCRV